MSGEAVEAAARSLRGVPFRLHGRGNDGLDCVGVVAHALKAGGWQGEVPTGYALRGGDPASVAALLDATLARGDGTRPGDLLLVAPGAGQLHLAITTRRGVVHADVALRRVVERPGSLPWPLIGSWWLKG